MLKHSEVNDKIGCPGGLPICNDGIPYMTKFNIKVTIQQQVLSIAFVDRLYNKNLLKRK